MSRMENRVVVAVNVDFKKRKTLKCVLCIQIVHVHVGQDQTGGPSKGLYVEEVEVTSSRGDRVLFPCRCWTVEEEDKDHQPTEGPPGETFAVFMHGLGIESINRMIRQSNNLLFNQSINRTMSQ